MNGGKECGSCVRERRAACSTLLCEDGAGVSDNLTELGRLTRVGFGRETSDADSGMLSATWVLGAFFVTERSLVAKASLILPSAACAGGSRSAGIWSPCSPFPWEPRSFHWLYMAQVR